jgi:hypothetical protein
VQCCPVDTEKKVSAKENHKESCKTLCQTSHNGGSKPTASVVHVNVPQELVV